MNEKSHVNNDNERSVDVSRDISDVTVNISDVTDNVYNISEDTNDQTCEDKSNRSESDDGSDKSDRSESDDGSDKSDRSESDDGSDKSDKSESDDESDKSDARRYDIRDKSDKSDDRSGNGITVHETTLASEINVQNRGENNEMIPNSLLIEIYENPNVQPHTFLTNAMQAGDIACKVMTQFCRHRTQKRREKKRKF